MFEDSFFTSGNVERSIQLTKGFRPHVWGFFFHMKIKKADYSVSG